MNTGRLCTDHCGCDAEDVGDPFRREHLGGRAVGDEASATQHQDLIGEAGGEVEIVNYAYSDHISSIGETSYSLHEIDLVTDVEKRQGLVQEKIAARINPIVAPELG